MLFFYGGDGVQRESKKQAEMYESTFQLCKACGSQQYFVSVRRGKITVTCVHCHSSTEFDYKKSSATLSKMVGTVPN